MRERRTVSFKITAIAGALAISLCATQSGAQEGRFVGQLGIYSVSPPSGWSEQPKPSYADVVFAPPGGMAEGAISVGLQDPKDSLEAEADMGTMGGRYWGRERITIDGAPCIIQHTAQEYEHNFLACHITVPFREGPMPLTLYVDGASPPGRYESQTDIFNEFVRSIRWGAGVIRP